MATCRV